MVNQQLLNDKLKILYIQISDSSKIDGTAEQFSEWSGIEISRTRTILTVLTSDKLEQAYGPIGSETRFLITEQGRLFWGLYHERSQENVISESLSKSIRSLVEENNEKLPKDLDELAQSLHNRGIGFDRLIKEAAKLYAERFENNCNLTWDRMKNLLLTTSFDDSQLFSQELKQELRYFCWNPCSFFQQYVSDQIQSRGSTSTNFSRFLTDGRQIIETKCARTLAHIDADIEHYVKEVFEKKFSHMPPTQYDRIVYWAKNNAFIVVLLIAGLILIYLFKILNEAKILVT